MDNELNVLECAACGYEIKYDQRAGFSSCGHANMHYTCSYLGMKCGVCSHLLVYDINQNENDFLALQFNKREDDQISNSSDVYNMLTEIRQMLYEQKIEQARQLKMIEDLKEEIKEYKNKETVIHELQTDIMQLKHDKVCKEIKDLQEKFEKLEAEINIS